MVDGANILERVANILVYDPSSPLLFSGGLFLFVFAGFMLCYSALRNTTTLRIVYVILFSLYFYYKTSGDYVLLLILVSISDFIIGLMMGQLSRKSERRPLMIVSVVINLGVLVYFKYTNFFIDIVNGFSAADPLEFKNIFLPVGISFFLFQSISYSVDIYRGTLKPLNNWLDYIFYLSFFPQLVAGPIVRAKDFIPQIRRPLRVTREMFNGGMMLILVGLIKKAIISDFISYGFVDRVFDSPLFYSGFTNLMAIYGYALQIYCDFSGYSDMAIGIALLLGFKFNKNFDDPYKSATITEFWRRWHISLSSWLRDYLYISLGGNRKGSRRTYINLMITMLLGGLWHGAAWRFVIWGGLHGAALSLHKLLMSKFSFLKSSGEQMSIFGRAIGIVITFNIVCLGWLLFRAEDMQSCIVILKNIFTNFDAASITGVVETFTSTLAVIAIGYIIHFVPESCQNRMKQSFEGLSIYSLAAIFVVVIWGVMQIKSADVQPFIYFQF